MIIIHNPPYYRAQLVGQVFQAFSSLMELQVFELLQYAGSGLSTDKYTGKSLDSIFKLHAVGAYRET
jgi:hypothetical protein